MVNALGLFSALLLGFFICVINFYFSKHILLHKTKFFAAFSMIRQVLNVGYLLLCYFITPYTPFESTYVFIGAALGVTLPMVYFTPKLLKISDKKTMKPDPDKEGA